MNRAPLPFLRLSPALLVLAAAMPLAGQQSPGPFSLPEPTPTPTPSPAPAPAPAPAGPVDEVARVPVPPRSAEQPPVAPSPVPARAASPAPAPAPAASPAASRSPTPARPLAVPAAPVETPAAPPLPEASPGFESVTPSAPVSATPPATSAAPPSEALGAAVIDWRWLAAGAALLASLTGGWLVWRQRKPKVLRLAAPVAMQAEDGEPALPRIDVTVEIPGSSRSVMTFTLRYRINLANRSDRAVNDLAVAVQATTARQGESNAAPLAAAQSVTRVERIGPHQSRSVTGEVQLPFASMNPIMQGRTMLFIPLLHVTLEGEGQQALARSFVIGTPGASEGRVQPLRMDMLPGSAIELRARAIEAPPPA
jgi:hypothetical protein